MQKPAVQLLLPGPEWPTLNLIKGDEKSNRNLFTIKGIPIYIGSASDNTSSSSSTDLEHTTKTAFSCWDASLVLAKYMEKLQLKGIGSVLELGSGRGISGMAAFHIILASHQVVLTDVGGAVIDSLRNIVYEVNQLPRERISVMELDWTRPRSSPVMSSYSSSSSSTTPPTTPPHFDLIIAADVVWVDELIEPLVETMSVFAGRETVILFAHQLRAQRSLDKFLNLLHLHGFTESLIPFADHDAYFRKEIISIYRITRRGCAAAAEEEEIVD